jgi:putative PIN family toxin of toxin-antitoxin system
METWVVVLDTNVWISGIFFQQDIPARILKAWRDERFELVLTADTLRELTSKLRQKAAQFGADLSLVDEWLAFIRTYARLVTQTVEINGVCRDPKDDMLLSAAMSGRALYIVPFLPF